MWRFARDRPISQGRERWAAQRGVVAKKKPRLGSSEAGHRSRYSYYRAACLRSGFFSDFFGVRRPTHTSAAHARLNTASENIIPGRLLSLHSALSLQLRYLMIAEGFPTTRRIPLRSVAGTTTA